MRRFWFAFVALLTMSAIAGAANYFVTQPGSGTTFGSIVVGGVNYAQMMNCDPTTPGQCASVDASGRFTAIVSPSNVFGVNVVNTPTVSISGAVTVSPSNIFGINLAQMGGSAINSGCVGALNGFSSSVPGTTCGVLGAYILNPTPLGYQTIANVTSVGIAVDQVNSTTGNIAANNTTAVVINAAATTLYGAQLYNIGVSPAYLKLYNATSATCGSGTPVKRLQIPIASTVANGAGSNVPFGLGVRFSTGLTYCVTLGITDADTTAPAANTVLVNLDWH